MPRRDDIREDPADRLGADRDRAGGRVRLLRRPGLQGAAGGGLRGRAGQLEPGDDHDRPGVRRPHLHRAAAARSGGQGDRARATGRAAADARRPDRPQPRQGAARRRHARALRRRADRRRLRGDPSRRGPRGLPHDDGGGRAAGPVLDDRRVDPAGGAGARVRRARRCRSSSGPPSRWAATAAASPTPRPSSPRSSPRGSRPARSTRCWSRSRCSAGASSSSR